MRHNAFWLPLAAVLAMAAPAGSLAAEEKPANRLLNPGFEQGLVGWKVTCDPKMGEVSLSSAGHFGSKCLCIHKTVASRGDEYTGILVAQTVAVEPDTLYVLRGYARHDLPETAPGHAVRIFVDDPDRRNAETNWRVGRAGAWKNFKLLYRTGPKTHRLRLALGLTYAAGTVWFDDCCVTPAGPDDVSRDIVRLKPLYPRTALVEAGRPQAVIVASARAEHQALARDLADRVQAATGARLPIKLDTEMTPAQLQATNVVALGDLNSNRLIERLYCRWYVRTDAWYPGQGGYELRTVHDPWGTGKNVILLGGSDEAGLRDAAAELAKRIQPGANLVLDRLMTIRLSPALGREEFARPIDPRRLEQMGQRLKRLTMRGLMSYAGQCAFNYYAGGQEPWALLFKQCLLEHKSRGELGYDTHMELWYALIGLDLVEESPSLTEADRKELTNYLLFLCRSEEGANKSWFLRDIEYDTIRHNHVMLAGLDAFFGGEYFQKYYHLEEAGQWLDDAARCFAGQWRHSKTQCDANSYESFAVSIAMVYALAKPDMRLFESGAARRATERLVRCLDNMLNQSAYGDSWDPLAFSFPLLEMANWHARDPRYEYLIQQRLAHDRQSPWSKNPAFVTGRPAAKPADLDGLQVIPCDPEFYAHSIKGWRVNVPLEKSFDKIAFRQRLDPAAQYLLLDGLNMGSHGHIDANTIIEFSDRQRMFLVDMSYTDGVEAADHNGVTVVNDGLATEPPAGAEVQAAADFSALGFSRTTLHEHSGTDWSRNILWRKGRYFLVFDQLTALQPGDFGFQCRWRVLGRPTQTGDTLTVQQTAPGDVQFVPHPHVPARKVALFRTQQAALEFHAELPRGKCALAVFAQGRDGASDSLWIDLDGKRLRQVFDIPVKQLGTMARHWDRKPEPNIDISAAGVHRLKVTLRENPGVLLEKLELLPQDGAKIVLAAKDGQIPPELHADQSDFFVLHNAGGTSQEIQDAGPAFAHYWSQYPYCEPRITVLRQQSHAHLNKAESYTFCNLFYAASSQSPETAYRLQRVNPTCVVIAGQEPALAGLAAAGFTADMLHVRATMFHLRPDGFSLAGGDCLQMKSPVLRASRPLDVEGDFAAGQLLLTAQSDTEVSFPAAGPALTVDGKPAQSESAGQGLRRLAITRGTHTVAGLNLGDDWRRGYRHTVETLVASLPRSAVPPAVTPPDKPAGKPLPLQWTFATPSGVRRIVRADIDGDGKPEIVVGTAGGSVYLLDDAGHARWDRATGGAINALVACDLDGSGQATILAGGDDSQVHAVAADGQPKWTFACPPQDASVPYTHFGSRGVVRSIWAGVLQSGRPPVVIVGAENGYAIGLGADGRQLWRDLTTDVLTFLAAADFKGDGRRLLVGGSAFSSGSALTALDGTGGEFRFHSLDGWGSHLTALAIARPGSHPLLAAGTSRNYVWLLGADGKIQWKALLGDVPEHLAFADLKGDGRLAVIVGSPSFFVYALGSEGRLLWRTSLGEEVTALATAASAGGSAVILAGTRSGRILRLAPDGRVVNAYDAGDSVKSREPATITQIIPVPNAEGAIAGLIFGTARGQVGALSLDD